MLKYRRPVDPNGVVKWKGKSSSSYAGNSNNAWNFNFNDGNMNWNNKNNSKYVRAVRSGKCSLLAFESVYRAYLDARRRKRGTLNALMFEFDALEHLIALTLDLQRGTYRPSRSVCFVVRQPKLREVFAADFRDRVVHHLVVRELETFWEPRFIHDSYACRKGKGTHAAVKRLQSFMLKATKSRKQAAWFLQIDIRSFFMSIDRRVLFDILAPHVASDDLRRLLSLVIFHDCTQNFHFKGDPNALDLVPPHKSLFKVGPEKGMPIGNLTSQFFANVYMNELDQFVKHRLRCKFYIRYVDDAVLLSRHPEELLEWKENIESFLAQRLKLELKPEFTLKRVTEGADFLGYIVRPDYLLCRRRVVNNLKSKLAELRPSFVSEFSVDGQTVLNIQTDPEKIVQLRQIVASYLGHFKHAKTHRLIASLFVRHDWLTDIFLLENGKLSEKGRLRRRPRFFRTQVGFFKQRFKDHVLFVRVGKYIELYDDDAVLMGSLSRLGISGNARGMKRKAGFLHYKFPIFIRKLLKAGFKGALLAEAATNDHIRDRYVSEVYRLSA